MDWAKDQLGEPVQASSVTPFSFQLSCGCCGARVYRRAGSQRRAHFAHYGHGGRPDCEYYFPTKRPDSPVSAVKTYPRLVQKAPSLRVGLFLEQREFGKWCLHIKLPPWRSTGGQGQIEIRSALGIQTFTVAQMQRPRLARVPMSVPPAEVKGSHGLEMETADVTERVSWFRRTDNYFHAGERGGRLLDPQEPLEEGGRYRLVTQESRQSVPPVGVEVVPVGRQDEWYLYEVQLGDADGAHAVLDRESAEAFLGRTVISTRGRVHFIEPPHHIEVDGTFVYPEGTDQILVYRTGVGSMVARQDDRVLPMSDLGGGWLILEAILASDVVVSLDNRDVLAARVTPCELFEPVGVRVVVGPDTWNLFDSGVVDVLRAWPDRPFRIECPSEAVADGLVVDTDYTRVGNAFELSRSRKLCRIDGGNFGSVAVGSVVEIVQPASDALSNPRDAWIRGVLATSPDPTLRSRGLQGAGLWVRSVGFDPDLAWLRLHFASEHRR